MMLSRMMPAAAERKLAWADAPCPLCRGDGAEVILEAPDASSRSGLVFCVVRCRECGLHYTNPRPDAESMARFSPAIVKLRPRRSKKSHGWLHWHHCPERRGELPVERPGRLLDVGCGSGSFLARMAARGWQVTGLDAASDNVRRIQNEMHLPAHVGTLPHSALAPGSFDAVTMWHSLEEVHDPLATLRSAFRLLTPGGLLLVACPNLESAPARWFGPDWFGLDLPRHLTHFSEATLKEMLILAGFRVRRVRGVKHANWLRSSAAIAVRRGHASAFQRLLHWKYAAKLFAWLTYLFGASDCLLVIAKRPG